MELITLNPCITLKNCAFFLSLPIQHHFTISICSRNLLSEWKAQNSIQIWWQNFCHQLSQSCSFASSRKCLKGYNKVINAITLSITLLQLGFQRNASTQQQLLIYFHHLITSREQIDSIYIDFKKAFDSVPHNKLLTKLWNIGIASSLWKWFNCYLTNRTQCVSVNNCLSNCLPVISAWCSSGKVLCFSWSL